MRLLLLVLSLGFVIASSASVEAAVHKKTVKKSLVKKHGKKKAAGRTGAAKSSDSHLQTSHNFEDHGVTGEYQMPDEALARVENEKSLTDLLGVRKHFKDRLANASEQE